MIDNAGFLQTIFRDNWPFAHVTAFPDDPSNINDDRRGICWAGRYFKDTQWPEGLNQYFTISIFNPIYLEDGSVKAVRRKGDFMATYCIVADDVGEGLGGKVPEERAKLLPPPSWKLETSPGSEQWGWILLVPEHDRSRVDNLLDGLVALGLAPDGNDPGMKGVTRYVRLPEGWNNKAKYGQPYKCRMLEWHPERMVTMEQLAAPFGVDLNAPRSDNVKGVHVDHEDHPVLNAVVVLEDKSEGEYLIECPWVHEHTDGDTSGTILYTHADGSIGFKCHHGHCQDKTGADVLEELGVRRELDIWKAFGNPISDAEVGDNHAQSDAVTQQPLNFLKPQPSSDNNVAITTTPAGEVPTLQSNEVNDTYQTIRDLILDVTVGDPAAVNRIIDGMAQVELDEASKEMLLGHLKDQSDVGIVHLRRMYKNARNARIEKFRKEKEQQRQQILNSQSGQSGIPVLRAAPGEILYPFTEGDTPDGMGLCHSENLKALCRHHGITMYHNLMNHNVEIYIPGAQILEDEKNNLEKYGIRDVAIASNMTIDRMDQMVLTVACESPYHPFINSLSQVEWDGVDRFNSLVDTVNTPHRDIFYQVLRAWMRAVVIAAMASYGGRPPRDVLVFAGEQKIGKTTWFRRLIPEGMFGEGLHLNPNDKDSLIKSVKWLVCELGELDGTFKKSDIAALKAHISSPRDEVRLPYAKDVSSWPRRTVYCGTVNDPEFLVDSTGNSRWKVVTANSFDLDTMTIWQRDGTLWQIWKQIEQEVLSGEPWWVDESVEKALIEHVDQYRRKTHAESVLEDIYDWDAPMELWRYLNATHIAEEVGLKVDRQGHAGVGPALKRLLRNYTGQEKAKRVRGYVGNVWQVPPKVPNVVPGFFKQPDN